MHVGVGGKKAKRNRLDSTATCITTHTRTIHTYIYCSWRGIFKNSVGVSMLIIDWFVDDKLALSKKLNHNYFNYNQ